MREGRGVDNLILLSHLLALSHFPAVWAQSQLQGYRYSRLPRSSGYEGRIRGTPKVWNQIQSVMVQAEATTCCMCSGCIESAYAEITDILRTLNTIESEP